MNRNFSSIFIGLMMIAAIIASFMAPGANQFQYPSLARIIFWHLPCAIISVIFHLRCGYFAYKYLQNKNDSNEIKMSLSMEMASLMASLTMITGMLFSRVQWGAWWQWDARQTSYLMLLFLFTASLTLQAGLSNSNSRGRILASYNIATLPIGLFLVFVYPRLTQVMQNSFHPSQTIQQGLFDKNYTFTLLFVGSTIFITCYKLFSLKYRVLLFEKEKEENATRNLEPYSSNTTSTHMVRPVSLSEKN